jgi:hypothetical protein
MPATTSRESTPEICARLKDLGYASRTIRACSKRRPTERVVFIPKAVVETARQAKRPAQLPTESNWQLARRPCSNLIQ